jgi:hypothetical protein
MAMEDPATPCDGALRIGEGLEAYTNLREV